VSSNFDDPHRQGTIAFTTHKTWATHILYGYIELILRGQYPKLGREVKFHFFPAIDNRWALVFLVVVPALLGVALGSAFWRFQTLHEEFLSINFDSMHGARTLLKAQFFLRETGKELDLAVLSKAPLNLAGAANLLSLAANYGAEGVDRNPEVRAHLVTEVQALQSRLAELQQQNHVSSDAGLGGIAELARATRDLSEVFGAAELERWAMLSSLNAELSERMRQVKWLIGAAGTVFGLIIGLLVWSMVRYRQTAHQLRQSTMVTETIQQSTLDTALSGILYLHFTDQGDRSIFRINRKFEEMFGYRLDELVGKSTSLLYASDAEYRDLGLVAYPAMARGEVYRTELRGRRKDGSQFWCSLAGRAIDTKNPSMGAVWMLDDISDRKQVEMDLTAAKHAAEEASVAKSRFLAAASHDLRQPMQAIGLFASALERTQLTGDQKRLSRNLTASTNALGELLDTLLDISKLDAGVVKPQVVPTELYELFSGIEHECASLAMAKKLRFKLFFLQRSLLLPTDPNLLLRLLRNVIGNCIKYTRSGGLLVGTRLRSQHLLIQVWDTGIGISPDDLPHIYDEFFQVANPQRDRIQGLGLGLSIVKRIATLMGYKINCRSKPGRGTVFEIWIPIDHPQVANNQAISSSPATQVTDSSFLNGQRIVIVEDDHFVAEALQVWFETYGCSVSCFPDGASALGCSAILDADFYVSDFRLPGDMTGINVLDAIQVLMEKPINALLITGDTSPTLMDEFAASQWKVLHKPIEPSRLLSIIAEMRSSSESQLLLS